MTINRLNQGTTNQVLVKAISGQTTNLLELQDSSGNVVSSIGPTGALGGTVSQPQGLVHINTTSFSAVASQSINDVFSATYKDYLLIVSVIGATQPFRLRLRASGSDASGSNYNVQRNTFSTSLAANRANGETSYYAGEVGASNRGEILLNVFSPFASESTLFLAEQSHVSDGASAETLTRSGAHTLTNSYTGFTIFPGSGSITGSVSTYGYRKS
jgi:hypothetical protein